MSGNEPFNKEQLKEYEVFLDENVEETFISYNGLKNRYGMHIKNEDGEIIKKNGGFFAILGIKKDTKFKNYLGELWKLPLEKSLKGKDVISVYQGIWYAPETQQYLVGSKNSYQWKQERGFVFRQIVSYNGNYDESKLFDILKRELFPMLEVNFIRFRDYTVYPFPFKLIEIWNEIQNL